MTTLAFRRTAIACALIAATAVGTAACNSSDDSKSSTTSSAAATSAAATSAAAQGNPDDTKAVTDAFVTFFNGKSPAATRAGLVENGAAFAPALTGMATNPQAAGTTVTVAGVTFPDATHADVKYTLLLNGAPVLPDQSGQAIKDAGTWKVAAATFCALLAIQGGGAPTPGC